MTCRWGTSASRKMILSGLLVVLIVIRHAVCSYQDNYGPRWPIGVKQQHHQAIHQHSLHPPHPHRHHHEHIHKSNREMHLKPHSHFHRDNDYRVGRPTTKATTTTTARAIPRTPSTNTVPPWKWSSTTAANLRLAEMTHISHQGGNETRAGYTAFKNRLSGGERQQWSANNKQIFTGPFRVKINSNVSASTSTSKTASNHVDRSSWSHYSLPVQQHEDRHIGAEDNRRTLLGKTSRIADVDPGKISHEDQRVKSITDNKEDYDDYYYDADDESDEATAENKIEETKSRQDVVDDFNFDYLDDEPNPHSDDTNQNSFKTETLTEEKWKNYGTVEAVEKSRRRYTNEGQSAATAHIQRIKEQSKCRWPHPKVIPVTEASKRFVPHCTILHRCGDDTGCCDYDTKTCVAKSTTTVHLHFFVIPLGGSASVEVRSFVNHTECHCVDRCLLSSCADRDGVNIINYSGVGAAALSGNGTCQCPSHFDVVQEDFDRGRCRCDCFNNNQACHILKRGQDGFPAEDQKCILNEKCQMPTCQYGRYSTYSGRCPKIKHQKRTISRYDYR